MRETIAGTRWALGMALLMAYGQAALAACPSWAEGTVYQAGDVVAYQNANYTALTAHTAYPGANWNPAATPTLWKAGGSCSGGVGAFAVADQHRLAALFLHRARGVADAGGGVDENRLAAAGVAHGGGQQGLEFAAAGALGEQAHFF
ncbi:carbohydrate-binding protein, partial [Chromobacterium vaccinii]|uniref:carbohydrate-binding protein n=1 Tax=Chromobacterium vaccinii TaxID=1108595 RepID=UPI00326191D2